MSDITLSTISTLDRLSSINDNFDIIESVINGEVLHTQGGNNVMSQPLDMNGRRVLNVPQPVSPTDIVRLQDLEDIVTSGYTDASLITYSPAGTGAEVTTVQTKLRQVVSVKDFGAVGDQSDSTAAFQAAANLVGTETGGLEIRIPRGDYTISNLDLSNKKGIRFIGDSKTAYAVVKVTGTITCNNTTSFSCENVMFVGSNFSFSTRVVTGTPSSGNYLFDMIDNCAEWDIKNCHFYGFDQVLRPNAGATNGSYIVNISNNYFGWNNTSIRADGILHWDVVGNTFSEDRVANFHVTSGSEFRYCGNKHENSSNAMTVGNIYLGVASDLRSFDCVITENTFHQLYGITLMRARGVVLTNNNSRQPKVADSVIVDRCEEVAINNNRLYGYDGTYRRYGIWVSEPGGSILIADNILIDYDTCVYIDSDYSVRVSDNILSGATAAITVSGCTTDRRVVVQNNTCSGSITSSSNTNYWEERNNRLVTGSFINTDSYMDRFYMEGVWTPSPTNLTVVGTPTYVGRFIKNGKQVTVFMEVSSTTSTASTAGTTYFSGLPYTAAYDGNCMSTTTGGLQGGVGLITGTRVYPASWTAVSANRITGTYQIA